MDNQHLVILSICDLTGSWTKPYAEAGYTVLRIDPEHANRDGGKEGIVLDAETPTLEPVKMPDGGIGIGLTVGEMLREMAALGVTPWLQKYSGHDGPMTIHGIILQPPCTHFAISGSQWWKGKDAAGTTQRGVTIVLQCLEAVKRLRPNWWVLENPVGRLRTLVPQVGDPRMSFDPCDYGDPYTKRTQLFGDFNTNLPRTPVEPEYVTLTRKDGTQVRGSKYWAKLGGKSKKTKYLRSLTPAGFANAFFKANP